MDDVRRHLRNMETARGVRLRAPRRAALLVALAGLILLLLAAEAQAYVPGQLIWAKKIGSSTADAGARAVAAGPDGATAVAGWTMVAQTGPPPMVQVPMVARYTAGGSRWVRTYTSPGRAQDVAIDRSGNVYVAATVDPAAGGDIVVLKYDAAGALKWATTPYDGTGNGGPDKAVAIAVDAADNVFVAGESVVTSVNGVFGKVGIVVLKYGPDGGPAGSGGSFPSSGSPNEGDLSLHDLALGPTGDVYVCGSQEYLPAGTWLDRAVVMQFHNADCAQGGHWYFQKDERSASFASIAVRAGVVAAAGVVWSGTELDDSAHALAATYDLNLAPRDSREWGVGDADQERFRDVVLDGKGDLYVTGEQWVPEYDGHHESVTLKLSPRLGKVLWKATYRPKSRDARGWYIARDRAGYVYVAGVKRTAGSTDFLTMKYGPTGVRKWLRIWSGGGPGDDEPGGLVIGTKGDLFVGGEATGKGDVLQAVVLRYKR